MLIYILSALFGHILHILSKLVKIENIGKSFSFSIWANKNKFKELYSLFAIAGIILVVDSAGLMTPIAAFSLGFSTDAFIKNLVNDHGSIRNPMTSFYSYDNQDERINTVDDDIAR